MTNAYVAPASKGAMALRIFLLVSIVGVVLMSVATAQRWLLRRTVLSEWPVASATIQSCFISHTFPFRSDGGGVLTSLHCTLHYTVGGRQMTGRVESSAQRAGRLGGSALQLRHGVIVIVNPDNQLTRWLRRHRPGATLDVHYNPANPAETTLVGADDIVDLDPVPGSVFAVIMFAALGFSARWGANRLEQRAVQRPLLHA